MDVLRVCTVRPNINVDGYESSDGLSATFLNQLFQIQANGINRAMFDLLMVEDFGCPVPRQMSMYGHLSFERPHTTNRLGRSI